MPKGTASHPSGWTHRYTNKLSCNVLTHAGSPSISCSFTNKGSFTLGPGGVQVTN